MRWQKWSFRVGFNPREGLVLHTVAYDGRPILYRGSIAEMIVPYADPKESSYRKNVFDLGEYGVGMLANSLALGCDCLGTIHYFDGHLADSHGRVVTIKNAICLHEEDFGMLWKHTDWRTNQSEVRRSRRLAVSMIATVGNYDYGFYWYFYQDGTIQMEVKLTGIMNTMALKPGEAARYGTEVAPRLNAPYHQHFFNARLDLDVDGEDNTVQEVNTRSVPAGPENPHGNAFVAEVTPLLEGIGGPAQHQPALGPVLARRQRLDARTSWAGPSAIGSVPARTSCRTPSPTPRCSKRAGFLDQEPLGDPVPGRRAVSRPATIPTRTPAATAFRDGRKPTATSPTTDLVVWYTFGQTHIPRLEDWPVMPVTSVGFLLRPDGFFDAQPGARPSAAVAVIAGGTTCDDAPDRGFLCYSPADSKNEESS